MSCILSKKDYRNLNAHMKQNSCVVASLKHDGMSEIIWFYCVRRLVLEVVVKLDKNHGDPF